MAFYFLPNEDWFESKTMQRFSALINPNITKKKKKGKRFWQISILFCFFLKKSTNIFTRRREQKKLSCAAGDAKFSLTMINDQIGHSLQMKKKKEALSTFAFQSCNFFRGDWSDVSTLLFSASAEISKMVVRSHFYQQAKKVNHK